MQKGMTREEADRRRWMRLWVAVDEFLDLRSRIGSVPTDAPEIAELIEAHWRTGKLYEQSMKEQRKK